MRTGVWLFVILVGGVDEPFGITCYVWWNTSVAKHAGKSDPNSVFISDSEYHSWECEYLQKQTTLFFFFFFFFPSCFDHVLQRKDFCPNFRSTQPHMSVPNEPLSACIHMYSAAAGTYTPSPE